MNSDKARLDQEKGRASEERFVRLFSDPQKNPRWMDRIEPASHKGPAGEDVDFVVYAKDGRHFLVNVKSSDAGKKTFVRRHPKSKVCLVVMRDSLRDGEMRLMAAFTLTQWLARSSP